MRSQGEEADDTDLISGDTLLKRVPHLPPRDLSNDHVREPRFELNEQIQH